MRTDRQTNRERKHLGGSRGRTALHWGGVGVGGGEGGFARPGPFAHPPDVPFRSILISRSLWGSGGGGREEGSTAPPRMCLESTKTVLFKRAGGGGGADIYIMPFPPISYRRGSTPVRPSVLVVLSPCGNEPAWSRSILPCAGGEGGSEDSQGVMP